MAGSRKEAEKEDVLRALRRRLWIARALLVGLLVLFAAFYLGARPGRGRVCLIAVDGRPAAVVESRADAERLLQEIKAASSLPPERVAFRQRVTFHKVSRARNPVQSDRQAMESLASKLDLTTRAAAILANGEVAVALPNQQEAVKTLSLLLNKLAPPGPGITAYFKERVKVEMADVPVAKLAPSAEEAVRKIIASASPKAEYQVKAGDSAWKIARDLNVPLTRLAHANPDVNLDHLPLGAKLKLPGPLAPITVVARKEIVEEVGEGPHRGTQKVRITYENGVAVKREIIGRHRPLAEPAGPTPARPEPVRPPAARRRAPDIWRWRDEIPR